MVTAGPAPPSIPPCHGPTPLLRCGSASVTVWHVQRLGAEPAEQQFCPRLAAADLGADVVQNCKDRAQRLDALADRGPWRRWRASANRVHCVPPSRRVNHLLRCTAPSVTMSTVLPFRSANTVAPSVSSTAVPQSTGEPADRHPGLAVEPVNGRLAGSARNASSISSGDSAPAAAQPCAARWPRASRGRRCDRGHRLERRPWSAWPTRSPTGRGRACS